MELFIIGRFRARAGQERAVAAAIHEVSVPTRAEPGCLAYSAFRSVRDPALFFIHTRWRDEAAFEAHAGLAHTQKFLATVELLIDHPLDVNRLEKII